MTELLQTTVESASDLFVRGGWAMWPLLVLSLAALTLILERCWFWWRTNGPGGGAHLSMMLTMLQRGHQRDAAELAQRKQTVYARLVRDLLATGPSDAVAMAAVEAQRTRLERYMPTLSTIITAAPMIGILGTVTGIIHSFRLLAPDSNVTDPGMVSHGIAEALLTTAAGLTVALVVLFPYNAFRAQIDRTMSRIEALIAAAQVANQPAQTASSHPVQPAAATPTAPAADRS